MEDLTSDVLDEDLSLPDGLWDYLMMGDDEDSSSSSSSSSPTILDDIILAPSSPTPGSAPMASSSTKTTKTELEEKLLSLEADAAEAIVALSTVSPYEASAGGTATNFDDEKSGTGKTGKRYESPFTIVEEIQNAKKDELDAILAKQMDQLSMNERHKYREEVHGIRRTESSSIEDTPDLLQKKFDELEHCLNTRIPINMNKDAYERAKYISPEYVYDRSFRLMFLRGELYDPYAAAVRIIKHFQIKEELFGKDLLTKHITIDDLTKEDIENIKLGCEQILPIRDSADRYIVCLVPLPKEQRYAYSSISKHRATFYLAMSLLHDEDAQKNGIVIVILNVGPHRASFEEIQFFMRSRRTMDSLPCRVSAMHYCYDHLKLYPFITFVQFLLMSHVRGRFVQHFGGREKYIYELQTYGIPTQALPMDEKGGLCIQNHWEWLEQRRVHEQSLLQQDGKFVSSQVVLIPRRFDVLLGRGKTASEHTGNLRAFHIVEMNRKRYELAGKFEKTQIAEKIVHLIHQSYGRFLKKDQDSENGGTGICWVETSTEEAREKISHCFRRLRELDSKSKAVKRKPMIQSPPGHQRTSICCSDHASLSNEKSEASCLVATGGAKRSKAVAS